MPKTINRERYERPANNSEIRDVSRSRDGKRAERAETLARKAIRAVKYAGGTK